MVEGELRHTQIHRLRDFFYRLFSDGRLLLYLLSVLVATILWFLHALGKEYNTNVKLDIEYKNFPMEKELRKDNPHTLTLNLTGYGFSLLRLQLKALFQDYKIDVRELRSLHSELDDVLNYNLPISSIRKQFEEQLGSGLVINSVFPEDVTFHVATMSVRKLPVQSMLEVHLRSGYMKLNQAVISPDSVLVRGVAEIVDTMKTVHTEGGVKENVSTSFEQKLRLVSPSNEVQVLADMATIAYDIVEYIEQEHKIKIQPYNFPDSVEIKLSPVEVNMKYKTYARALQNFRQEDFVLIVDYEDMNTFTNKLEVKVLKTPKGISHIAINPRYVNYVISYK